MSKVQILALSITGIANVSKEDMGRYSVVVPASSSVIIPPGTEVEFFDRSGRSVKGMVVSMHERVQEGKFPDVKGLIIDTKWETYTMGQLAQPKRMQAGGVQRLQQRTPSQPKLNKRTTPAT